MDSLATARAEWDAFLDKQAQLIPRLRELTHAPCGVNASGAVIDPQVLAEVAELLEFSAKGCPFWPPADPHGFLGKPFEEYLRGLSPEREEAYCAWEILCERFSEAADLLGLPYEAVQPVVLLYVARPDLAPQPDPTAMPMGSN